MRLTIDRAVSSRHSIARAFALALVLTTSISLTASVTQGTSKGSKQAVVTVEGMQCPFCAYGIRKHLAKLPGAKKVDVDLAKNEAVVTFARDAKVTDKDIQKAVRKAGFTAGKIEWRPARETDDKPAGTSGGRGAEQIATFAIAGMRCLGCEAKITSDVEVLLGVHLADVDWQTGLGTVRYDSARVTPDELMRAIERAGNFQATLKTLDR
jgi:copper ion binding protein